MREGILRNSTVSLFDWIGPAFALHQKRPVTNKCSMQVFIYMGEERPLFCGEGDYSRVGCPGFLCVALKTFFGKLADQIFLSPAGFGVGFTILCVALQTLLDNQCVRNLRSRGSTRVGIGAPVSLSGFESCLGSRVHKSLGLRWVVFLNPLEKQQIDWSWRRVSTMSGLGAQLLYNLASLANTIIWGSGLPVFAKRMQPEAPNLADPRLQEHSICSPFGPSMDLQLQKYSCLLGFQEGPTGQNKRAGPHAQILVDRRRCFQRHAERVEPKGQAVVDTRPVLLRSSHQLCCGFGVCSCPLFLSCSSPSRPPKNFVCQSSNYEQNWNQHPRPGGPWTPNIFYLLTFQCCFKKRQRQCIPRSPGQQLPSPPKIFDLLICQLILSPDKKNGTPNRNVEGPSVPTYYIY